jgi:hypothetical protein
MRKTRRIAIPFRTRRPKHHDRVAVWPECDAILPLPTAGILTCVKEHAGRDA